MQKSKDDNVNLKWFEKALLPGDRPINPLLALPLGIFRVTAWAVWILGWMMSMGIIFILKFIMGCMISAVFSCWCATVILPLFLISLILMLGGSRTFFDWTNTFYCHTGAFVVCFWRWCFGLGWNFADALNKMELY